MDNEFSKALLNVVDSLVKSESAKSEKYLLSQVRGKLASARQQHPNDQAITAAFFAIDKQCQANPSAVVSRADMNGLFNDVIGLRTTSNLRDVLADYIDEAYVPEKAENTFAGQRMNETPLEYDLDEKLSNNLNGMFDSTIAQKAHTDKDLTSCKNIVDLELRALGFNDVKISKISSDESGVLYNVGLMTPSGQQSIAVPVQINDGRYCVPTNFVSEGKVSKLTRDNVVAALFKKANTVPEEKFDYHDVVELPSYELTDDVKDFAPQMDEVLYESQLGFPTETIHSAKRAVKDSLFSLGFLAEVAIATAAKDGLVCSASIKTKEGHISIHVPVEVVGDRVMLPSKFGTPEIGIRSLNKEAVNDAVKQVNQDNMVLFGRSSLNTLDYGELRGIMVEAAQHKSYTQCEEVLGVIQNKFGDEMYADSFRQYQELLAALSSSGIKKAASKDINDIKRDNMEGVLISTSRIVFT